MPVRFTAGAIMPGYNNLTAYSGNETVDIGGVSNKFSTVYANTFNGTATVATALDVGGNNRSGSVAQAANTIVVRDGNGDIFAGKLFGTATSAQYADLAEKYRADKDYKPGTVLIFGGEAEVTESVTFCNCLLYTSDAADE